MRNFIKANARVILGRKEDEKSIGLILFNKKNLEPEESLINYSVISKIVQIIARALQ